MEIKARTAAAERRFRKIAFHRCTKVFHTCVETFNEEKMKGPW